MRFPTLKSVFFVFAVLSCVSTFWAQKVYWSPDSGTMQEGKSNTIDLVFEGCQPEEEIELPTIADLQFTFRGRSNSTSIINGRVSAKTSLSFQAVPLRLGTVTIPSIRIGSSEGEMQVPPARFEVVKPTVGNTGLSPSEVFMSVLSQRDKRIYEGEVFTIEYIAGAKRNYQLADLSTPDWTPNEIVTSGLEESQSGSFDYQGANYIVKLYEAKAIATEPGVKELPATRQDATVVVGRRRDFMFQEPVYDTFTIESEPLTVEIQPLPEGAPESFTGAVGKFTLESKVVPEEVQVGEPVTWTLTLSGAGNWPAGIGVPARSVSSRFKAIQPEIKNEFSEDNLFMGSQSEDIVLIPTEEGTFEFGPVTYTYFDPETESYQTIEIDSKSVTVVPTAPSDTGGPASNGSEEFQDLAGGGQTYNLDPTGQNVFNKPPELLRETQPGKSSFEIPSANVSVLKPTLIALACPAALWFFLALGRSFMTDPRKPERKALAELRKIANTALPSDASARRTLHLKWRKAAARYFALSTVEPTPDEVSQAAMELRGDVFANNWKTAWQLSDMALFGSDPGKHEEWHSKLKQLAGSCPGKNFSPTSLFKLRAWVPSLIMAAAFCLSATQLDAQTDEPSANELYQQGNFKAAAAKWTTEASANPKLFEPRYNAGLAYAQSGDWPRAWAFWTSAYCLDPSDEAVAWNLRIAHQNTSAFDPVLQSLITGENLYDIVNQLSPAAWQSLAVYSIWLLGGFMALAVVVLYLPGTKRLVPYMIVIGILCGLLSYFSLWSHGKYEALGEPDTILVISESRLLSVPTDLQSEQVSTTVGEGTVVKQEKTFLSWVKIRLPNGETGWLRKEKLLPLYGDFSQL